MVVISLSMIFDLVFSVTTQLANTCDLNAPTLACSQLLTPPAVQLPLCCLDLCWPACVHSYRSEGKHGEKRGWGRADQAAGKPASGFQTKDSCSDYSAQRKSWLISGECREQRCSPFWRWSMGTRAGRQKGENKWFSGPCYSFCLDFRWKRNHGKMKNGVQVESKKEKWSGVKSL